MISISLSLSFSLSSSLVSSVVDEESPVLHSSSEVSSSSFTCFPSFMLYLMACFFFPLAPSGRSSKIPVSQSCLAFIAINQGLPKIIGWPSPLHGNTYMSTATSIPHTVIFTFFIFPTQSTNMLFAIFALIMEGFLTSNPSRCMVFSLITHI